MMSLPTVVRTKPRTLAAEPTRLFEIDRLKPDSREHLAIVDAVLAGDEAGVRQSVALHMQSLIDVAIDVVRGGPQQTFVDRPARSC